MAFEREENITKDSVQDFAVNFFVPGPLNTEGVQSGTIEAQLFNSDDTTEAREYDLLARLQDDAEGLVHLANLIAIRDYLRIRLDAEVLPIP